MEKIKMLPTEEIMNRIDAILGRLCEISDDKNLMMEESYDLHCELNEILQEYETADFLIECDGKYGVMDVAGNVTVPPVYKEISATFSYDINKRPVPACDFNDKFALVAADGKGTPLCGFEYETIVPMLATDNLYSCKKRIDGKELCGVLDEKGCVVVPCEMDTISNISNNFAYVHKGGKIGALMRNGTYFEPVYDDIYEKVGLLWARKDDEWGLLTRRGEFVSVKNAAELDEEDLIVSYDY